MPTEDELLEEMFSTLREKWGVEEIIRRCTVVVPFDDCAINCELLDIYGTCQECGR